MTDQITLACRNCVFWQAQTPNDAQALCNRYPGNVVAFPEKKLNVIQAQQEVEWKLSVMLPPKKPTEWCGEFSPRPQVVQ